MCGICGVFSSDGHPDSNPEAVSRMMDRMAHRGPDGQGAHQSPYGVLGSRRLAIIDPEHGQQPMLSEDGRFCLVFNGEIYNYLELRQFLIQQGVRFRTFSDTEVLLNLLARRGAKALDDLNGMFAFAFLDLESGEWLLARDHLGVKPLYYSALAESVVFGSEAKALFEHPGVQAKLDWEGLQHYLTFQFCLGERTLFAGISSLEPGFFLRGKGGRIVEKAPYWDLDFTVDDHHTEAYFSDRLLALLQDSARIQIRSDVPVGAYLSGGLDSSIVSVLAGDHLSGGLRVFHGLFREGKQYDESSYAAIVAEKIGAELITVVPTAKDFVEVMPMLMEIMDEPAAGPGAFPQYMVSREAAKHVKVILGGQGGDEVFGGYARYLIGYLEQALKGGIFETQEEGQHLVTLSSIIPNLTLLQDYRPLMQHFWSSGLFEPMDARYFHLINRSPHTGDLLTADASNQMNGESVFESFQQVFNHPDTISYFNKMTHFDLKTILPALLHVEDRVSMSVSLESRVPLLDKRVVELAASMPPVLKFKAGKTKQVLREAVGSLLPEQVTNRKDKMGFPVPLTEWFAESPVREFVHDTLGCKAARERGFFRPEAVKSLLTEGAPFGRKLWGVLCLELWAQTYLDGR